MATTATIQLEGYKVAKLYKHWDGHPSATLQWLEDFNKDFVENRGDDPSYKFAQLIRSSASDCEKYDLDPSRHTGWGVYGFDSGYNGEYQYRLMKDGTVQVSQNDFK
jgi:hypothetical protein